MKNLPSNAERKTHYIRMAAMNFDDIQSGKKTFELLKNDSDFKIGDSLYRQEYVSGKFTGRSIKAEIIFIVEDCNGLEEGYCILGTRLIQKEPEKEQVENNE